ncbi:phosphoglucosamine mutase [Actomonas aquatica]|uniref:Phosphoglucosamine mutase n=1 Tax=Actomonas aquatica TaxID=2866162 RepID=A0ABZ1C8W5_9BACT|nr:phosphoglucosamine mutase [Opitutus sp. WL0086]WRQ87936.1 phosphoglucosamine mutase [Opitutus sp. WL0086]
MKRRYFGTDGVRGPFGGPVINTTFAARLGHAVGSWIGGSGRVLIGRDSRASGEVLEQAVAGGLVAAGLDPVSLGVLPTPAVARAVREGEAVLGVVITASHNPATDNGIKFFNTRGEKLSDAEELAIEAAMVEAPADLAAAGSLRSDATARADYVAALVAAWPSQALAGWKIVLDTAHGATVDTSPVVLRELGAEVVGIGDAPDGHNINAAVGSEHPAQLAARVVSEAARIGIAHDGDGDRCVLCDETGAVLDGDEILTLLAVDALRRDELTKQTLVVTKQSNLGVDRVVTAAGGRVLRTDIGDRYVSECMRAEGAVLGGESSGHIICAKLGPTGDGLAAALQVLRIMHETGEPLSRLRLVLQKFPQKTGALRVEEKVPLPDCPHLQAEMAKLEAELGASGRLLVRYSGTEPKLRLLVEGPDEITVESAFARLVVATGQDLKVVE